MIDPTLDLPIYDWPGELRRAYTVYLQKMDAAILQALGDGYRFSQLTFTENHRLCENGSYFFEGKVHTHGAPLNRGMRHQIQPGRPPMIDGHPAYHWGGRIHNLARRGLADPARARWKLASSRRRWQINHGAANGR